MSKIDLQKPDDHAKVAAPLLEKQRAYCCDYLEVQLTTEDLDEVIVRLGQEYKALCEDIRKTGICIEKFPSEYLFRIKLLSISVDPANLPAEAKDAKSNPKPHNIGELEPKSRDKLLTEITRVLERHLASMEAPKRLSLEMTLTEGDVSTIISIGAVPVEIIEIYRSWIGRRYKSVAKFIEDTKEIELLKKVQYKALLEKIICQAETALFPAYRVNRPGRLWP